MNLKMSVVIPVYNVEAFLTQCIESIIYQSHKNLEIIIVDDGSPDNSAKIYEKYAKSDKRIKVIKQKNGGLSKARNTGLAAATGDYVHFIDSDDYINCDYYEKMLAAAKATDADIAAGGVVSQNGERFAVSYKNQLVLSGLVEKFRITGALVNCTVWRHIYRRKFLEKNNLKFADGRIFEDLLFMPETIMRANRVVTVPGAYYQYVFNPNSILNKGYTPRHREQFRYARAHRNDFVAKYGLEALVDRPLQVYNYKFLSLRFLKKEVYADYNRYYLFGIRVFKTTKELVV